MIKRILFLIGALWECLRIAAVSSLLLSTFRLVLLADPQGYYWLIVFGSAQGLLPAALFLIFVNPDRYMTNLLNLVRLGKTLSIAASLLLVVLEPLGRSLTLFRFFKVSLNPTLLLLSISFIDLIFLFILFSYKQKSVQESPAESLPDFTETTIAAEHTEDKGGGQF